MYTQLNLFTSLMCPSTSPEVPYQLSSSPPMPPSSPVSGGHPRKSAAGFVGGRDHDFVENEKKRPALCAYCGGMIQREDEGGSCCDSRALKRKKIVIKMLGVYICMCVYVLPCFSCLFLSHTCKYAMSQLSPFPLSPCLLPAPISKGVKCKTCKMNLHHRCQNSVTYCHGTPPTKPSSKSAAKSGGNFT